MLFIGGQKAYCGLCGWNVRIVSEHLRSQCQASIAVAILGIFASGFAYLQTGWVGAVTLGAFFGLNPALFALKDGLMLKRLRSAKTQAPIASRLAFLDRSSIPPRPRNTVLTWQGWLWSSLIVAILLAALSSVFIIFSVGGEQITQRIGTAVVILVCPAVFIAYRFLRQRLLERYLLKHGEVTQAKVMSRRFEVRSFPSSRLRYQYNDSAGRQFENETPDWSGSVFEEMVLTVFYNVSNPSDSIALECGLHKIA